MNSYLPYRMTQEDYIPALGGLFSWLKKAVRTVVNVAASVMSGNVFQVVNDAFDGDGMFGGEIWNFNNYWGFRGETAIDQLQDYPLTAKEEAVLDNWLQLKFIPLFTTYLNIIDGWRKTKPTEEQFAEGFAKVNEFAAFLIWLSNYIKVNGEPSKLYSFNATATKAEFLRVQAGILLAELDDFIKNTGTAYDAEEVVVNIAKEKYAAIDVTDAPTSITLQYPMISNDPVNSEVTVTVQEPYPAQTSTNTTKKSKALLWGVALLAGIVIYKISKPKTKK